MSVFLFPFGVEATARPVFSRGKCRALILGAYPSALHIRWTPPGGGRTVVALPVDNEPEPFWDGKREEEFIRRWQSEVAFKSEWGEIAPVGRLNGSSGDWVNRMVLEPLSLIRDRVWITDCLPDYRASTNVEKRILDTYNPFANQIGIPTANLKTHPSESEIVKEASGCHLDRLKRTITACDLPLIITLGNAALRTVRAILANPGSIPARLKPDSSYGRKLEIEASDIGPVSLLPLAHPAAPHRFQTRHELWVKSQRRQKSDRGSHGKGPR